MEIYQYNALTSSCNKVIRREMLMKNKIFYKDDIFLMKTSFSWILDTLISKDYDKSPSPLSLSSVGR